MAKRVSKAAKRSLRVELEKEAHFLIRMLYADNRVVKIGKVSKNNVEQRGLFYCRSIDASQIPCRVRCNHCLATEGKDSFNEIGSESCHCPVGWHRGNCCSKGGHSSVSYKVEGPEHIICKRRTYNFDGALYLVNHSCKPNARLVCIEDQNCFKIIYVLEVLKKVVMGEEVLIDYGDKFWRKHETGSTITCGCGEPTCKYRGQGTSNSC